MVVLRFLRAQWDRAGAVLAAVVGLVLLIEGWYGVSGTPYLAKQLPYLAFDGLLGLFFVAVAAVLWLSADLRDEWRQLRFTNLAIRETQQRWQDAADRAAADRAADTPVSERTAAPRRRSAARSAHGARQPSQQP